MNEGRLKGSIVNPDYDFLDPRLDSHCEFLHQTFHEWMFTRTGMLAKLRWHQLEVVVLEKFYPYANGILEYKDFLREIIASSNALFFHIAENAAKVFEDGSSNSEGQLRGLVELQSATHLPSVLGNFNPNSMFRPAYSFCPDNDWNIVWADCIRHLN